MPDAVSVGVYVQLLPLAAMPVLLDVRVVGTAPPDTLPDELVGVKVCVRVPKAVPSGIVKDTVGVAVPPPLTVGVVRVGPGT